MPDWLGQLNDRQYQAVTHGDGPLLILAGAGSGKTRALTYRIAYLIHERGLSPHQILAITFTNKAAGEMKERVARLLGTEAPAVWVATFHSTCARMLRREAPRLGYSRDFAIYDGSDQRELVREVLAELRWDDKRFPPQAFLAAISDAKNRLWTPDEFAAQATGRAQDPWADRVLRVYRSYQRRLERNQAFDFDDLIVQVVRLLESEPEVRATWQQRWGHLLVDEYQDTNHAQYRLVRALASGHRNLSVVGDDDQSIYGFRGADTRNILEFEKDFPEARVVLLEENYRSTTTVLEAANLLVRHNRSRKPKRLWTRNPQGEPIRYYQATDQRDEAAHVAGTLSRLRQAGEALGDCAVLYRANAQSRLVEEALIRAGLAYQIVGGLRFHERKEVRDLLAYLRLLLNPADAVSLGRVINVPRRGVGPATWARIVELSEQRGLPVLAAMAAVAGQPGLPTATRRSLEELGALLGELAAVAATLAPEAALAQLLKRTGYQAELVAEGTPESQARLENLEELMRQAAEHTRTSEDPGLRGFLEQAALVSDADTLTGETDRAALMTVHMAKGLEFGNVLIIGMDEGLFPHLRSLDEAGGVEEERRLAYVAITRAQRRLFLSSATARVGFGGQMEPLRPSRFLGELPTGRLEVVTRAGREVPARPAGRAAASPGAAPVPARAAVLPEGLPEPGEKVCHPKWGEGTVVAVAPRPDPADSEITVAFAGLGLKRLVAGYARLDRLGPRP